jgi:hypothetical protein
MQDNPNTDNTNNQTEPLLLDREDWELAFEPFEENAYAALKLGFTFARLRMYLDGQLFKSRQVINALDQALEVLFPFTEFHDASFELFKKFTEGKLTMDEEQMLNALGVKF